MLRFKNLRRRSQNRGLINLRLEPMDGRCLPSATPMQSSAIISETEPNDVLGEALDLGTIIDQAESATGVIGVSDQPSSDVDCFSFKLSEASKVVLSAINPLSSKSFGGIITLYVNDPYSFSDPSTAAGVRLLKQTNPASGDPSHIEASLPAGTYYFALSAAGNRDFHPYLADSGLPGPAEDYEVSVTATSLKLDSSTSPQIIGSSPDANAELSASPLVLRVELSAPIDPSSVIADGSVTLFRNSSGDFKTDPGRQISSAWANFSIQSGELQVAPTSALEPGYYRLVLHGDSSLGQSILTDSSGVPLGCNETHPDGQDFEIDFRITAVEGGSVPNDTAPTASQLGDLGVSGTIRIEGVIGDDPTQDPNDPVNPTSPGSDVDLYHFKVSGPGRYELTAEVFAGRIGSRLDAGASLFRLDPLDGELHLVTANEDTQNSVTTSNGLVPLFTDPVLYAGLLAGDYYLAVSARNNTPDPSLGFVPGKDGVFDPNISHSGLNGTSVGEYLLSASLRPAGDAPKVISSSLDEGSQLESAPTQFEVEFSSVVNLRQSAFQSYSQPTPGDLVSVFLLGANSTTYYPRLTDYDPDSGIASFSMLDRLPEGDYELHLSGSRGLKDFADQELIGNDPSGDFLIHFHVSAKMPGVGGDPLKRESTAPDNPASPQDLGTLFPRELQAGIEITRSASTTTVGSDIYRFDVLQAKTYVFNLDQTGLNMRLSDLLGNSVDATLRDTGDSLQADLQAGVYFLTVDGWKVADSQNVAYRLRMVLGTSPDNPPPLTIGPRPASIANLVPFQNTFGGESQQPLSPQPPNGQQISNTQTPSPLSSYDEKINLSATQHRSTDNVGRSGLLTSPSSPSNTTAANLTGNPAWMVDSKTNASEASGRNSLVESPTQIQIPFIVFEEDGLGEKRFQAETIFASLPTSKNRDRTALPASLLAQLRAEPVGGVRIEEEITRVTSFSVTHPETLEVVGLDETTETTLISTNALSSNGWGRNFFAVIMLILAGGTAVSRQISTGIGRTRTRVKSGLLGKVELIRIGR